MAWSSRVRRTLRLARARWLHLTRRGLSFGPGCQVKGPVTFKGPGVAVFGAGCRVGMGARHGGLVVSGPGTVTIGAGCTIDAGEIYTLNEDATIAVGDGSYLNRVEIGATTSVTFGQRCEIGSALIYDTDFHAVQRVPRGEVRSGPILVGDDVWVGARTAILRGVSIGSRSVIGMGVVVTRDVAADTLVRPAEPRISPLSERLPPSSR